MCLECALGGIQAGDVLALVLTVILSFLFGVQVFPVLDHWLVPRKEVRFDDGHMLTPLPENRT